MFFNKKFNCLKKWYDFINEFENIRFNSKQIIDLIMARRQDTTLGEMDLFIYLFIFNLFNVDKLTYIFDIWE